MRDDLQFAALHSDDALLDALAARTPGASLGVAAGVDASASPDPAARLLGAWTHEIDTRPGPLTDLLSAAVGATAAIDRPLTPVEAAAAGAGDGKVAGLHARRRRSAMPRAAAVATASVLVLGLGGVAAAVSGGPLEPLRRAVGSVSNGNAEQDPAQRATALLLSAEEALDAGDFNLAAERMTRAQNLLPQVTDAKAARTLRAKIAAFQARWQRIVAPVAGALSKEEQAEKPSTMLPMLVPPKQDGTPAGEATQSGAPTPAGEVPQEQLVPEAGMDDPSNKVPLPDPGLSSAKEDLADTREKLRDRAKEKLDKDKLNDLPENRTPREVPQEPMPGDLPGPAEGPLGGLDPGSRPLWR